MKKNKSTALTTDFDLSGFNTPSVAELPSSAELTKTVEDITERVSKTPLVAERNIRKRETMKGTILQAVMIEKDLLKQAKLMAVHGQRTLSDVVNEALRSYVE